MSEEKEQFVNRMRQLSTDTQLAGRENVTLTFRELARLANLAHGSLSARAAQAKAEEKDPADQLLNNIEEIIHNHYEEGLTRAILVPNIEEDVIELHIGGGELAVLAGLARAQLDYQKSPPAPAPEINATNYYGSVVDCLGDVAQFHFVAEIRSGIITTETLIEGMALIEEEAHEFAETIGLTPCAWLAVDEEPEDALADPDDVNLLMLVDDCADLAYVALGRGIRFFGEPCFREIWQNVHKANMAKMPGNIAVKDAVGKVIKPEGWEPPDHAPILRKYGFLK